MHVAGRDDRLVKRLSERYDLTVDLPQILLGQGSGPTTEILDGLRTTGHFLTHWLVPALGDRPLPAARQRLIDALSRA